MDLHSLGNSPSYQEQPGHSTRSFPNSRTRPCTSATLVRTRRTGTPCPHQIPMARRTYRQSKGVYAELQPRSCKLRAIPAKLHVGFISPPGSHQLTATAFIKFATQALWAPTLPALRPCSRMPLPCHANTGRRQKEPSKRIKRQLTCREAASARFAECFVLRAPPSTAGPSPGKQSISSLPVKGAPCMIWNHFPDWVLSAESHPH